MIFIVFSIYLLIFGVGITVLWVSHQLNSGRHLSLIRANNKPLPDADLISKDFSRMLGFLGVAIIIFSIAIPVFGIRWGTWHFYLGFLVGIGGVWRSFLLLRHAKLSIKRHGT